MAEKVKNYYDLAYAKGLGEKLKGVYNRFDVGYFLSFLDGKLESLEFNDRQVLLAESLHHCFSGLDYVEVIGFFEGILGPELKGNLGMFSEGYWLWPVGKYVELYGSRHFEVSTSFSKELTKRFTGEFCMRPIISNYPRESMQLLLDWSVDENMRVRRLSSECIRIRLPWAKKLYVALDYFDQYIQILNNLRNDEDKSIQKSVANNLNDLYKEAPDKFESIIQDWKAKSISSACAWVIKHASRTKEKKEKLGK